jgi:hypothetical protein
MRSIYEYRLRGIDASQEFSGLERRFPYPRIGLPVLPFLADAVDLPSPAVADVRVLPRLSRADRSPGPVRLRSIFVGVGFGGIAGPCLPSPAPFAAQVRIVNVAMRIFDDSHDAILALGNQMWQSRTQLLKYLAGANSSVRGQNSCRLSVALFINRNG